MTSVPQRFDTSRCPRMCKYDQNGIEFLSTTGTQKREGEYFIAFQGTFKDNFGHKIKQMVFIYAIYFSVCEKCTAVHCTGHYVPDSDLGGIKWEFQY